jgi:hypothetical protein
MAAPEGNQNARKSRMFEQAVIRAIKARDAEAKEDGATLRKIAESLLDKAGEELAAMVQLRDTLDGKPAQAIIGDDEQPLRVVQRIERVIIDNAKD